MTVRKLKEISGHSSGVYNLTFDETFLYSASADKYVARWKIAEGIQDTFSIRFEDPVYCVCLFDENQKLAVGLSNGNLHFFDLHKRLEIKFIIQHQKALFAIKENPFFQHLYVADADGNLSVWDTKTFELLAYLPFDCGKIRRIALNSDGKIVAMACQDGRIRIVDAQTLNLKFNYFAHSQGVTSMIFHPENSSILFSGGKDAYLKKWHLDSLSTHDAIPAHHFAIYDLLLMDRGEVLVSASRDKTIKIWKSESLEILARLDVKSGGHRHSVNCLTALDKKTFASASDDRKIIIWGLEL